MPFVLDSSVTLAWLLPDEASLAADHLLEQLSGEYALVPAIWPLEIANVLIMAQRRGRISQQEREIMFGNLRVLPIKVEETYLERSLGAVVELSIRYGLTSYDAAYLELAQLRALPLATLDERLRAACTEAGIAVLPV